MKLSVIITAHDEGLLLHKAILSIRDALSFASIKNYEIVVHVDNASLDMEKYLNSEAFSEHGVVLYKNTFGDISDSRNFCVNKATGDYIFFIDADDLISRNFFKIAMPLIEKQDNILIHAESCLSFDDNAIGRNLWIMSSSGEMKTDIYHLFEKNLWISSVLGKKEIFENTPYRKVHNGYGNEDYAFNLETLGKGISHRVAPGTVYFYRKKAVSLLSQSNLNRLTQRYMKLFDLDYWKKEKIRVRGEADEKKPPLSERIKNSSRNIYVSARSNVFLNTFITPMATLAKKVTGVKLIQTPRVPDNIIEQWKYISKIEPQLYPTKSSLKALTRYDARINNMASDAFSRLARKSTISRADYIFVVPWVKIGGADKVLINYLNALREIKPNWKIAVITTLASKNEWASKIPDNACLFDYGNVAKNLYDDEERDILFTRLIIQLQSKRIHIINSEFAYNWAYSHRMLLEANYDLRISLFCHDIIPNTNGEGVFDYADPYASRVEPYVSHIFTDNKAVIDKLVTSYGFNQEKIKVHFQPFVGEIYAHKKNNKNSQLRILWASRICTQKKPELVIKIAENLESNKYHIDMYGSIECGYDKKMFSGIDALEYRGGFNGLDSIDIEDYDCFLYTSFIDGLPNIILEVASKGLPIVASDAGGVKDFIRDKNTGILVSGDDPSSYVKALEYIYNNRDSAKELAENASCLLRKRHSWDSFVKSIKEDF